MLAVSAVTSTRRSARSFTICSTGCYAPFPTYRQLRETDALRRFSAIWRTTLLMIFSQWVMIIFAELMTAMAEG